MPKKSYAAKIAEPLVAKVIALENELNYERRRCGDVGPEETPDIAREEIARLIEQGNTSGLLDGEDLRTSWRLVMNSWKD